MIVVLCYLFFNFTQFSAVHYLETENLHAQIHNIHQKSLAGYLQYHLLHMEIIHPVLIEEVDLNVHLSFTLQY